MTVDPENMTYRQYVTEQSQLRDDPQVQAEIARWYGSGEITSAGATPTREILNRMPAESARWYGGFTDWRNRPSNDILPDENYGSAAAYQRTFEEVNYETNQEYWERFPNNPTQPINPRQYSAVNRLRKRRALELIASRAPQTLENYPSLRSALANTDLTEDDARRLINVAEMDQAFIEFTNTGSETRQKNILLSMNPVQRAAFFDFSQGKIEEFMLAAAEDPSWAESAWNGFFGYVVEPLFNTLLWLNEKSQQTFRANMYAFKQSTARGLLGLAPGFGYAINAAQYWDEVAPGTYDIEGLASAREKYGEDVVNTILDLEEMRRDGLPDAIGRWEEKYSGTDNEWIVRGLVYKAEENQELLDAANEINTYDLGNTGMLTLSMFGVENRNMFGYSGAANVINIAATFLLDPTIIGTKALGAYRAARYSLVKFAGPGGIEEVFRYRRTRNFFNLLGRDLNRLEGLDAGKAALARETMRRQYGRYMPPEVIDEMARYGVRNADEAKNYFIEWDTAERIIAGQQGRSATSWFERFYAYSDGQRRIPLTPGMSTGGILRNRTRRLLSVANPINGRFDILLKKQFGDIADDGTFVMGEIDPQYVAQQLNTVLVPRLDDAGNQIVDGKGIPQFQLADTSLANVTGVKARLELLGDTSKAYGYTYRDKSISARIDRLQRRGARLPMPEAVYLIDGRDAGRIYEFARAFLPRYHATFIADAWRKAPNAAVRKQIFDGLVKTAGAAKGVHLQKGKNAEQALMDLLPETKRGGVYSPTLRMRQTPEGVFVVDDGAASLADTFNIVDQRPSNFDGQEFALHLWQTADYAALPRYDLFEEAGVKAAIFGDLFGTTFNNVWAKSIVDAWSIGNLIGPRYAVRNAVEDWTMYAATGGSILGAYRGRRAAMAIREARGPYYEGASAALGVQGGKRQRLGMVASRLRRGEQSVDFDVAPQTILDARRMAKDAAKRGEDLDPRVRALSDMSTWHMIKPYFTDADRAIAAQALRDGDVSKMQVLIATVVARSRFTSLTPAQQKDIVDLASEHSFRYVDEVGETAMYENSGLYPGFALADEDPSPIVLSGTDDVVESKIVYQINEFKDIALSGDNPLRFTFWHRGIVGSANRDGIIGKIAIGNLDKPDDEIIPIIAEAIRSDTRYGYKEKMAAFYQKNISEEEFARRYLEDVRNLFHGPRNAQGQIGELNDDLWRKIVTIDDDGRRIVTALDESGDPVISSADLIAVPLERRPSAVLGRDVSTNIPTATNVKAFDKAWRWMGEQNARISREPIFMANYLEQRKLLRPYEQMLAREFGEEIARKRVSQMATSRAHEFSLSYMDNPRVRTILAWNVRNVARYYRATEDFARRFMRLGTKYPEGIWKVGLTYDVMDETGFVYTDARGEKYFVFPGSAMTMQALNWGMSGLGQNMLSFDAASYEMIGKVRMTTPSADPKQWLPTASSPLAALAIKPILSRVPALKSFEQAILGEYSENSTLWESILPAAALRVMRLMDSNERYSMYASTYKDAIQVATAADKMPGPADSEEEWERFEQGMNTLVTTMLFTKSVFGFFALAAPQIRANDVTQFAREKGRLNMDEGFRSMIDKNKDEPNPFAAALVDWASTYGLSAVPYSMSSSESGNKYGGLAGLTSVAAVEEGEKWVKQNPDLIKNYKTGSAWLLPRSGTFSQDMWNWLEQTGFKQPKSYRDALEEAKTVIGRFVFLNEREYADNIILGLQNSYMNAVQSGDQDAVDSAWESLKEAENRRTNAAKLIRKDYPELDFASLEIGSGDRVRALNNEIRPMLNYMFNERDEPPKQGEPAWNMQEAILTFDAYMSRIDSIQGTTDAADMDKRMLRFEISQILDSFGDRDENTRFFVDSILLPLANPTSRYGDLSLSLEEARQ